MIFSAFSVSWFVLLCSSHFVGSFQSCSYLDCLCRTVLLGRAVANGPVGPAMAGPIIEPAFKKINFLIFIFWLGLVGIIKETVLFLDILF